VPSGEGYCSVGHRRSATPRANIQARSVYAARDCSEEANRLQRIVAGPEGDSIGGVCRQSDLIHDAPPLHRIDISRYDEITSALTQVLEELGTEAIWLYAIGVPMVAQGFTQEEIVNVLISLNQDKVIELLPDNQVRVLSGLTLKASS
jgi:hypothetical protein